MSQIKPHTFLMRQWPFQVQGGEYLLHSSHHEENDCNKNNSSVRYYMQFSSAITGMESDCTFQGGNFTLYTNNEYLFEAI